MLSVIPIQSNFNCEIHDSRTLLANIQKRNPNFFSFASDWGIPYSSRLKSRLILLYYLMKLLMIFLCICNFFFSGGYFVTYIGRLPKGVVIWAGLRGGSVTSTYSSPFQLDIQSHQSGQPLPLRSKVCTPCGKFWP